MAEIVFSQGPYTGNKLEIPETGIVLGRSDEADLAIEDEQISGQHARLFLQDEVWHIADLQSSNGTTLNGIALVESVRLNDGDVVGLGDTLFTFTGNGAPVEAILADAAPEALVAEPVEPIEAEPVAEVAVAEPVAEAVVAELADPVEAEPIEEPDPFAVEPTPAVAEPAPEPAKAPGPSIGHAASKEDVDLVKKMSQQTDAIRKEVGKVIVGQQEVLDQVLMCIIAGGHALLIGLPGMAKTLMVSTIAKVLSMEFKRVQFTPDLMPTDIIGSDVLETNAETGEKEFRFIKGPIFCNMLLADEINRTPPKTQAALLEAMQEKCVTAGNTTYTLDKPFFVLATQNPIEQEGTYPLPEAQLDRFMFNIWVDYPLQHEEEQIIGATTTGGIAEPQTVLAKEEIIQLQQVVRNIPVSEHVIKYVIRLVRATRPGNEDSPEITKTYVSTGAGPRAGQNMVLAAKAMAVLEGRIHVSCNDIRRAATPVLRHRLGTNFAADSEGLTSMDIVDKLVEQVKEPGEEDYTPQVEAKGKKKAAPNKKVDKKAAKKSAKRK